jgi:hypothetical protein
MSGNAKPNERKGRTTLWGAGFVGWNPALSSKEDSLFNQTTDDCWGGME